MKLLAAYIEDAKPNGVSPFVEINLGNGGKFVHVHVSDSDGRSAHMSIPIDVARQMFPIIVSELGDG